VASVRVNGQFAALVFVPWRRGNMEWGSSTRDFERRMNGALGMERLSLKRLGAVGLWRGLLY
jgi:hypothetical protein